MKSMEKCQELKIHVEDIARNGYFKEWQCKEWTMQIMKRTMQGIVNARNEHCLEWTLREMDIISNRLCKE